MNSFEVDPQLGIWARLAYIFAKPAYNFFGSNSRSSTKGIGIKSKPFTYWDVVRGLAHLTEYTRKFQPAFLVGINRGGTIIGGMIAKYLNIEDIYQITVRHDPDIVPKINLDNSKLRGKKVILVDDRLITGKNISRARQHLISCKAEVSVIVFAQPHDWPEISYPNLHAFDMTRLLPFPWEVGTVREIK